MKRTPLKRKTPMRKISKKHKAKLKSTATERSDWAMNFTRCWVCGWVPFTPWPHSGWQSRLETHEITSRTMLLSHYFRTCQWCHQEVIPGMDKAEQMAYKLLNDREHYDLAAVNETSLMIIHKKDVEEFYESIKSNERR